MQDILLDSTGDIQIANGDFVIGESTSQEIKTILTTFRGEFKEHSFVGAELQRLIKSQKGVTTMKSIAREQLEADGFKKIKFTIENDDINVNAERNAIK